MSGQASPAVRAQRSHNPLPATYTYFSPFSQQKVLGSAQRLLGPGWIVLTEQPTDEAFGLLYDLQKNSVLGLVLALGLASLATLSLTRRVLPPIRDLIHAAERIQQGDEHILTRVYREDELGMLAQAFNRMTERQRTIIYELEQARLKAEESARLKSEFIATMSHELRTPLNAIEGFTSLMLEDESYNLSDRARTALERVSTNSKHLLRLINDLLDFSKLEAGGYCPRWYPCAPTELGQAWQAQMMSLAEKKGLNLQLTLDPDLPSVLISDMDALNKIGLNLLSNALKFTEQGEVELRLARDGQDWLIIVRDTGIGISPEAQDYIFEEFRQVDGSLTRRYGGTGLGLAIVRRLTTILGGEHSPGERPKPRQHLHGAPAYSASRRSPRSEPIADLTCWRLSLHPQPLPQQQAVQPYLELLARPQRQFGFEIDGDALAIQAWPVIDLVLGRLADFRHRQPHRAATAAVAHRSAQHERAALLVQIGARCLFQGDVQIGLHASMMVFNSKLKR